MDNPEKELNHLHAWSFFLFFLPWCHKTDAKYDKELDNWFANQGLLNWIAWAVISAVSTTFFVALPFFSYSLQILNILVFANALYGVISYY